MNADNFDTATTPTTGISRRDVVPTAIVMHIGLAIVCLSAVYTRWQFAVVTYSQWAVMLIVAAVLLYAGLHRRHEMRVAMWSRLTLAIAGLLVLRLAYSPQLEAIPRLGEQLPELLLSCYPGMAIVGVAIALFGWWAFKSAGGEHGIPPPPFRRSITVAVVLVWATALFNFFMLRRAHGLLLSDTFRAIVAAVQGGVLMVILVGIGGAKAVGRAPYLYFAGTLIAAFVRNLAGW